MLLDFLAALNDARIGGQAGLNVLSNAARTPAQYLLATVLPERDVASYTAKGGSMTVRSTMAGAVGMDSKYPEGGAMSIATFMEEVAKIAIKARLQEATIRELQALAQQALLRGGGTTDLAVQTVLNFTAKLLLQPHYDRREWLRGQALFTGGIDWQFNGVDVQVDYGVPSANILATRTGNNAYGGSTSMFWADVKAARQKQGASYRGPIATRATVDEIIYNEANKITVLGDSDGSVTVVKYVGDVDGLRPQSTDARERTTIIVYDKEGEVWDLENPGQTVKVPLIPDGVLGFFASNDRSGEFIPGEGSTNDPENDRAIGYSHIGPTVENQGRTGIWTRIRVPEDMPMQMEGDAVETFLPVVENPDKIFLTSTAMS